MNVLLGVWKLQQLFSKKWNFQESTFLSALAVFSVGLICFDFSWPVRARPSQLSNSKANILNICDKILSHHALLQRYRSHPTRRSQKKSVFSVHCTLKFEILLVRWGRPNEISTTDMNVCSSSSASDEYYAVIAAVLYTVETVKKEV